MPCSPSSESKEKRTNPLKLDEVSDIGISSSLTLFASSIIFVFGAVYAFELFQNGDHMEYISVKEASEKWGLSTRRVQILCTGGRIKGAGRIGNMWVIPKNAEKPKDARVKNGKYVRKPVVQMKNTNVEEKNHG